jgi:hypothetical protein
MRQVLTLFTAATTLALAALCPGQETTDPSLPTSGPGGLGWHKAY